MASAGRMTLGAPARATGSGPPPRIYLALDTHNFYRRDDNGKPSFEVWSWKKDP
jgi:hypothetical protein